MNIVQLNIFDCDKYIQRHDDVYEQIAALQIDQQIYISDIRVLRTSKFYVVAKNDDFEEPFKTVGACYEFVNRNL
ncbi:hypothetical protein A0U40_09730 [[Bacillus] sp. KCTC 13219]|nr:hypothetical protein A0U40_09730 [[Bacillus] sp. KCTC 13219]